MTRLEICWLVASALLLSVGASSQSSPLAEARSHLPELCIGEGSQARVVEGWHPATLEIALGSTSDPALAISQLERLLDRLETKANPLAIDFEADDAPSEQELARKLWPRVTAAQSWLAPALAPEGNEIVDCASPRARYALWNSADSTRPLASLRLRHIAWAASAAGVIESPDPRSLARRLRIRSEASSSSIALVIEPHASVDGLAEVAERARRIEQRTRRFGRTLPPLLGLLAQARPGEADRARLEPNQLMVVPRLGSLARLAELSDEIATAFGPQDRWIHRPTFLSREAQ